MANQQTVVVPVRVVVESRVVGKNPDGSDIIALQFVSAHICEVGKESRAHHDLNRAAMHAPLRRDLVEAAERELAREAESGGDGGA